MEKVSVSAPFEPLVLDIAGQEVRVNVDVSTNHLGSFSKLCLKNGELLRPLDEERAKAIEDRDQERIKQISQKQAELIEPIIVAAIGEDGYERTLIALGAGERIDPARCIESLVQIMAALSSVVRDHFSLSAAQTTAGAANALQTTDRD